MLSNSADDHTSDPSVPGALKPGLVPVGIEAVRGHFI